ncbi:MAG: T9SS type A sorting domain-containing protein [Candidatus Marinimicrobia bacterium]|nr:T9SS type A sorting domain-containing protein [Candidatus Neomarinimicrobiota bacterium]
MIFNNKISKKIKWNSLLKYIFVFCIFTFPKAQDIDTLMYFDENDSLDMLHIIDDVSNLGVRFTPDSTWDSYDIIGVEFLTPEPYPYSNTFEVYNADGEDDFPGTLYDSFSVLFNDSSVSYPYWNSVDVSSNETLKNISGDFWVTGAANFITYVSLDTNISGHTYAYLHAGYPCGPCWRPNPTLDITIRAIVALNDNVSISQGDYLINDRYSIDFNAYPNPFNSNISFELYSPNEYQKIDPVISIYNINGQIIFTKKTFSGSNTITWNGVDLHGNASVSGIYFVTLTAGNEIITKKITIIK